MLSREGLKWWKKAFFHLYGLHLECFHCTQSYSSQEAENFQESSGRTACTVLLHPCSKAYQTWTIVFFLLVSTTLSTVNKLDAKQHNPQRECAVCSHKSKHKFIRFECQDCDMGLHVEHCFMLYHTKKDFEQITE